MAEPLGIKLKIKPFTQSDLQEALKGLKNATETTPIKLKIKVDTDYIQKQVNSVFSKMEFTGLNSSASGKIGSGITKNVTAALTSYQQLLNQFKQLSGKSSVLKAVEKNDDFGKSLKTQIDAASEAIQKLNSMSAEAGTKKYAEQMAIARLEAKKLQGVIGELDTTMSNSRGEEAQNKRILQLKTNMKNLISEMQDYLTRFPQIADSGYGTKINNLMNEATAGTMSFDSVKTEWASLRTEMKTTGAEAESLGMKLKTLFTAHMGTAVALLGVHALQEGFQLLKQNIVDVDTAMTELKKVTDESAGTYNKFLDNAGTTSQNLGASVSDYINSTADWARLGYSLNDAQELSKVAVLYHNVGDEIDSASTASTYLISTLKGFGLAASDAEHVLDVINKVSNTEPVSAKGLGEILIRASAAMSAAGNTFEETIALGTAMNAVLRDSEKTGTTLKTVSMYLRSTKTDLEAAGESTEGMAETTSKLREKLLALTHQKVDIQLDADTYKSSYQILKEMSAVWKEMTDKEQAAATELLGGKRNANAVSALLKNFDIAEESLKSASNAAGSAMTENARWLDSINGKVSQFKAAFQSLSVDAIDSGLIKGFISLGTELVKILDLLAKTKTLLPAIVAGFAAFNAVGGPKSTGFIIVPTYILVVTRNECACA